MISNQLIVLKALITLALKFCLCVIPKVNGLVTIAERRVLQVVERKTSFTRSNSKIRRLRYSRLNGYSNGLDDLFPEDSRLEVTDYIDDADDDDEYKFPNLLEEKNSFSTSRTYDDDDIYDEPERLPWNREGLLKDSSSRRQDGPSSEEQQQLSPRRRRQLYYTMDHISRKLHGQYSVPLRTRIRVSFLSIGRVIFPTIVSTVLGVFYYDNLSIYINENFLDAGSIQFLSSDEIQFIPSFLTVISLLFSILAGNAFSSLYEQQETIYFALYREVSEAKSLLEQMALVCSGRPFYRDALRMMKVYIKTDLRRLDVPPADLISRSPSQDPLEAIMYLTSVGVPSVIYETVRDLRQARGYRLGAMQRKFPRLGVVLLWILAILELAAFPLLGAGTAVGAVGSTSVLNVQSALFGGLCGATTLVLRIIQELWRTSGGAFNVDAVLTKMVRGLSQELDVREQDAIAFESNVRRRSDRGDNGGFRRRKYNGTRGSFSEIKINGDSNPNKSDSSSDDERSTVERLKMQVARLETELAAAESSAASTPTIPRKQINGDNDSNTAVPDIMNERYKSDSSNDRRNESDKSHKRHPSSFGREILSTFKFWKKEEDGSVE